MCSEWFLRGESSAGALAVRGDVERDGAFSLIQARARKASLATAEAWSSGMVMPVAVCGWIWMEEVSVQPVQQMSVSAWRCLPFERWTASESRDVTVAVCIVIAPWWTRSYQLDS